MTLQYFSGQGKVLGAALNVNGTPGGYLDLGNCSELTLRMGINYLSTATGGSEAPPLGRRSGEMPRFSLTLEEFSVENLARALHGASTTINPASIPAEPITGIAGYSVPLLNMNLASFTSLTNNAETVTYVRDIDYTVDLLMGMLTFPTESPAVGALKANYQTAVHHKVSMGTMAPPFMSLRFHGLNTATDGPVLVELFKTRLYPLEELSLISDSLISMPLSGRLFRDPTKTANTTDGQWLRVRKI